MAQQHDHLPDTEMEAVYYHLMTAQQHDPQRDNAPLPDPTPQHEPDHALEFHPDDVEDLVVWEQYTNRNIGLWLVLSMMIAMVLMPHVLFFTPLVSLFFATMSVFFFIRAYLTHEAQVIRDVEFYIQHPTFQWMTGGFTLAVSFLTYYFAVMIPYSAVSVALQPLLFLVSMNFALYTPIAIMRVIRQRTLRRKRRLVE